MLHHLLNFLISLAEFLVFTVVLKAIVAHWLAEKIVAWSKPAFEKTERRAAIWAHYNLKALGQGHMSKNILHCGDGTCKIL